MAYKVPGQVPISLGRLVTWIRDQLVQIGGELADLRPTFLTLEQLHAEPSRLYDGLTVYADGTDWNPGSGEGVYTYYNSAWNKLG